MLAMRLSPVGILAVAGGAVNRSGDDAVAPGEFADQRGMARRVFLMRQMAQPGQ
jgi:hypothetical protein